MRAIELSPALLLFASVALAAPPGTVDLNGTGVLEQLKASHPQRYQAVTAVLRASARLPCKSSELEVLKTRFDLTHVECGMVVLTSYPAKRHVDFELEGTRYAATVILRDAGATLEPAGMTTELTEVP